MSTHVRSSISLLKLADLEPLQDHNYQPKSMETSALLSLCMLENFTNFFVFC